MTRGGSRPRSGPAQDPNSATSEKRRAAAKKSASPTAANPAASAVTTSEFNPMALPAQGRGGNPPAYPLPKVTRYMLDRSSEGKPVKVAADAVTDAFRKREFEIWREIWKTPQAVAWERDPWRWPTIAEFCRVKAIVEAEPDANAALVSRLREYRNEIGLTPDGLRMNGWAIAPDQLAAKRADKATKAPAKKAAAAPVRRLRG